MNIFFTPLTDREAGEVKEWLERVGMRMEWGVRVRGNRPGGGKNSEGREESEKKGGNLIADTNRENLSGEKKQKKQQNQRRKID